MSYKFLFASVVAGILVTSPAMASIAIITFTFDENGNGTVSENGLTPVPLHTIPGQGTLAYDLTFPGPFGSVSGDVVVREPIVTAVVRSDLLRFTNNTGLLLVYSDIETSEAANLADVGVPGPPFSPNAVFKDEVGPENGLNGVFGYTPGPGDPGAIPGVPTVVYNFISDTPEPASITLAGIGALGLIRYGLRRRKCANA